MYPRPRTMKPSGQAAGTRANRAGFGNWRLPMSLQSRVFDGRVVLGNAILPKPPKKAPGAIVFGPVFAQRLVYMDFGVLLLIV